MTATVTTGARFASEWADWHRAHEQRRADRHGFLAITSLHWLTADPQRFDDAPGEWATGPDGVVVDLGDEQVTIDGSAVSGRHAFGVIPERGGVDVAWGDAVIEVAKRGGADIVRPRHPDAPRLAAYPGTPAYAPDPAWALDATYVPFDAPRPTTVGAVVDGLQHVYDAPGEVRFRVDGQDLALTVFPGTAPGTLMVLFTDATSGVTTYPANRVLALPQPGPDGAVRLDFTRAVNLPCAYTPLATCPLPPAENHLPIAVEAGEKAPLAA